MFCASPSRSPACPPRCSSPGVPSRAELRGNCPSDRVSTLFFELCVVPYVELKLLGCVVPLHAHTSSVRSTDEETEGVSNVLLRKLFNGVTAITSPRLPRVCSLPPMFCLAVTFSFSRAPSDTFESSLVRASGDDEILAKRFGVLLPRLCLCSQVCN